MEKIMSENTDYQLWEVKDTDGEEYKILADDWECGGNGLKFYREKLLVAWFIRWANYRIVPST
jgi:hypothetical protein